MWRGVEGWRGVGFWGVPKVKVTLIKEKGEKIPTRLHVRGVKTKRAEEKVKGQAELDT